jgi:hypothetical protein
MSDCQAAQAAELVRALRNQLHRMTTQLARLERQDVTGGKGRAVRMEAAELRRDIKEAQTLINQLQRRYLNGQAYATGNPGLSSSSAFPAAGDGEGHRPRPPYWRRHGQAATERGDPLPPIDVADTMLR